MKLTEAFPGIFDRFDELKYQVGERILNMSIVEQASKRNECQFKMQSLSIQVVRHLIKLYKWTDPQEYKGYTTDISSWMYEINRLRSANKKRPTLQQYQDWLWNDDFGTLEDFVGLIKSMKKYNDLPVARSNEEVYTIVKGKMYAFIALLSKNQFHDPYEILDRI
jgi:hypothetical protein